MWGCVAVQHKETAPQWDNYAENECGEIVLLDLTARILLMFGTDYTLFTKKSSGAFSHDKDYFIMSCTLLCQHSTFR